MKSKLLILSLAAAVASTGCATTGTGLAGGTRTTEPTTGQTVAKGAGIGCLAGAGLAFLTGNRDEAMKACAAGAVVGGLVAYKRQLDRARALEQEARAIGFTTELTTKKVEEQGDQGEALDALTVRLDARDIASGGAKAQRLITKLASMADESEKPVTVTVQGTVAQRAFLVERLKASLRSDKTTVREVLAAQPAFVLTPVPEIRRAAR